MVESKLQVNEWGQLPPQVQMNITSFVSELCDSYKGDEIRRIVIQEFQNFMGESKQSIVDFAMGKIEEISKDEIFIQLMENIQKASEATDVRLRHMGELVTNMRKETMPAFYMDKIMKSATDISLMQGKISDLNNKIQNLLQGNFIEIVTNEELQHLYKRSGVTLKVVADKFKVSDSTAMRMAHGTDEDYKRRHELKLFLMNKVEEKYVKESVGK